MPDAGTLHTRSSSAALRSRHGVGSVLQPAKAKRKRRDKPVWMDATLNATPPFWAVSSGGADERLCLSPAWGWRTPRSGGLPPSAAGANLVFSPCGGGNGAPILRRFSGRTACRRHACPAVEPSRQEEDAFLKARRLTLLPGSGGDGRRSRLRLGGAHEASGAGLCVSATTRGVEWPPGASDREDTVSMRDWVWEQEWAV